mmetsp:Transcript_68216/g.171891  ORF Transcript_68216/g.171891 Transcript_68216/m.171891 type:complete len:306 (-) Transcript_68216:2913-3830(-)
MQRQWLFGSHGRPIVGRIQRGDSAQRTTGSGEALRGKKRQLGGAALHQATDGVTAPSGLEHGPHLLHKFVAPREVVHSDWRWHQPLPTRSLRPWSHGVVSAAIDLKANTNGQTSTCNACRAQPALSTCVNPQIRTQQRHNMLHELQGLRHLGWGEGVLCKLLICHCDITDCGKVECWRLSTCYIKGQRQRSLFGCHAESEFSRKASTHREANKHILCPTEVCKNGLAKTVKHRLIVFIVGWDLLIRTSTSTWELNRNDLNGIIGVLSPWSEDCRRATGKRQAIRANGRLLVASAAKADQSPGWSR